MDEPREFLTVPEVARALQVGEHRAYALAGTVFPATRIGRRVRIPRAAFDRWLQDVNDQALDRLAAGSPAAAQVR
jgi:excisionase family DNA binding protein